MNHIHEGIAILQALDADEYTQAAFAIHPITQCEENYKNFIPSGVSHLVKELAEEYAIKANSYLCKPETFYVSTMDDVYELVGDMSYECIQMLYADKIQNRKDFELYHKKTHPKTKELAKYFNLWIFYLKFKISAGNY